MTNSFKFLMLSAMYENGGNTTQRFLDGHPELFSYPFESQPGTKYVQDYVSSLYPLKYRWPVFPLHDSLERDYETIIDEECKVRIKTPQASKFKNWDIGLDDKARKARFIEIMQGRERTRANLMEAFFRASADCWTDYNRSGEEKMHVGYSPIIVVDADKIVEDYENSYVLQVVRNPWSAYADTKKRAVPLSIAHYMTGWCFNQMSAMTFSQKYPDRVFMLRFEDIVADPVKTLSGVLRKMGIGTSETLSWPSWNGNRMEQVYPWGTVRTPTPEANFNTACELSDAEVAEIRQRTQTLLGPLGYENYMDAARIAA